MKKRLLVLMMCFAVICCLAACGGGSQEPAEEPAGTETEESGAAPEEIVTDAEAGTVAITAQVNGTFFDQSTMHCVVFKDGGAADSAMLAAYCDSQDFYDAMVEIGGEPWNTTGAHLEDGEFTDGQKVDISFTWDGQSEPVELADAVKTDSDEGVKIDMRFSGNQQGNKEAGSGCIACLNSCWAGITSNAAYGFGAIDAGNPKVFLNDAVMPEDGTNVQVTFTLHK